MMKDKILKEAFKRIKESVVNAIAVSINDSKDLEIQWSELLDQKYIGLQNSVDWYSYSEELEDIYTQITKLFVELFDYNSATVSITLSYIFIEYCQMRNRSEYLYDQQYKF